MIREPIHQWLSATYGLPVVEDITQTAVEQVISYNLVGQPINIRHESDKSVLFEFGIDIQFRCPNGFDGIGFLSIGLIDAYNHPLGFNLVSATGLEVVEHLNNTEMIISKPVTGFVVIEHNMIRELIKCIHMVDGLNCDECTPGGLS